MRKHCVVSEFLVLQSDRVDWLFVFDADTGVVNPSHRLHTFLGKHDVQLIFYERFYNWEIASGNYAVRNTGFTFSTFCLKM